MQMFFDRVATAPGITAEQYNLLVSAVERLLRIGVTPPLALDDGEQGPLLSVDPSTSAQTLDFIPVVPPALTASQNNYNPGTGTLFELTATGAVNITGWLAPPQDGQLLIVKNVGSNAITLTNQDAASIAANEWWLPYGQSLVLTPLSNPGGAIFVYQNALPGWLCLSFIPPAGSNTVEGVVNLLAQRFLGVKQFDSGITIGHSDSVNVARDAEIFFTLQGVSNNAIIQASLVDAAKSWLLTLFAPTNKALSGHVNLQLDPDAGGSADGSKPGYTLYADYGGAGFKRPFLRITDDTGTFNQGFTGTGGGGDTFISGFCTVQGTGPTLIAGPGIGVSGNTISSPGAELSAYYNNF